MYATAQGKIKRAKKKEISDKIKDYFVDKKDAEMFVEENILRKRRNLESRRIRMFRKAALQEFNYFCTFTYDPQKMDEDTFKKKLSYVFQNQSTRKGMEAYRRMGEISGSKEASFSRSILYPRWNDAERTGKENRLQYRGWAKTENAPMRIFRRKVRT